MPMTADGLAKLVEECGEVLKAFGGLVQVLGKKLAYYHVDIHPDGGPPLSQRLEEEIGDVMAACRFVADKHNLNETHILARYEMKRALFEKWHLERDNNRNGFEP